MKPTSTSCLIITVLVAWTIVISSANADTRHVVLLYDERTTLPGMAMLDASLRSALAAGSPEPLEIYRETMDLSRFNSDAYASILENYLRAKYAGKKIDVAVAVMWPALDFLLTHGSRIFPGTPIVFSGVDRRDLGGRPLPPHVTGVLLKRAFAPTLDVALRLQPNTERAVVVAGTSAFDERLLAEVRKEFQPYERRVAISYMTGLPFEKLLMELSQLPPRTIVLYTTLFQDGAGQPFVPHDAAERISAAANAPVYGFVDQYLGRGIIGGSLYSLNAHGEEAAKQVLQVLAGSHPSAVPVAEPESGIPMFDWRQLQRWGIDERLLPSDAIVEFRQPTLWNEYQYYVLAAAAIIASQALMIGGLLLERSRRRRAENELRDGLSLKGAVLDSSLDAIVTMDAEGKIVEFNPAAETMFGYHRDGVIGQPMADFMIPTTLREQHKEGLANYLATGEARALGTRMETYGMRVDGSRFPIELSVTEIPRQGLPIFTANIRDLTPRKRSEAELQRHRQELTHVSRVATMGELTASVAHQLKQPLAAILSNAEAAELYLDADPPQIEMVRNILADIRKDDRSAAEIINGIRNILQKHQVEPSLLDVNSLLDDVVRMMRIEAAARDVAVKTDHAHGRLCVIGERIHLQQVIMNFVMNALEAMDGASAESREIVLRSGNGEKGMVVISVVDTGSGIPSQIQSRLFEPFFTTKKEGLGVGLSIARTIIEAHQGKIWMENNEGPGATFFVALPAVEEVVEWIGHKRQSMS